jgi:hypothetical protein
MPNAKSTRSDAALFKAKPLHMSKKSFPCFSRIPNGLVKAKHALSLVEGTVCRLNQPGLRVSFMEDPHGFILHSLVCQKTTDDKVAVPMVEATKAQFPNFIACSFDKGFHSPENQKKLKSLINQVILPKKASYPKPIRNANTHGNLYQRKSNIQPLNRPLTPWK